LVRRGRLPVIRIERRPNRDAAGTLQKADAYVPESMIATTTGLAMNSIAARTAADRRLAEPWELRHNCAVEYRVMSTAWRTGHLWRCPGRT
jgi:hypothetical protein